MRDSSIDGRRDGLSGGNPSPSEPCPRSRTYNGFASPLPGLLLGLLLLFTSATVMVLDVGCGGETRGLPENAAVALATGSPPVFLLRPDDPTSGDAGVSIMFQIVVQDSDKDNLNVTWDWGDGLIDTNLTPPAFPLIGVLQSHIYNPSSVPGYEGNVTYTLNISLDDGNGNTVWDLTTINVKLPRNAPPLILDVSLSYSGSKIRVNPDDEVTITANASDSEGEPLTWTFVFSNSVEDYLVVVNHTGWTAPGAIASCNVTQTFSAVGSYVVKLNVSDGVPPYDVWPHNVSEHLHIEVVPNVAPGSASAILVEPGDPLVRSETGYVLVNYSFQASDDDGDVLTATWDFDDGSSPVVQASPGGSILLYKFIQQRNYSDVGTFNVSVTVSDGHPGHEIFKFIVVQVNSTNRPPSWFSLDYNVSMGAYALRNELLNFTLVLTDPERDPIEVTIDFGDNSPRLYFNLTDFVGNNVTISFSHSYANLGNYSMQIWYTDNKIGLFEHYKLTNVSIEVDEPRVIVTTSWSWWDYASLGLFCMIPVLAVVRFVQMSRRRKFIEDQGMTYDEWKLLKGVKAEESPKMKEGGP